MVGTLGPENGEVPAAGGGVGALGVWPAPEHEIVKANATSRETRVDEGIKGISS